MKGEHRKDLSLLYYDFNNSKARLMSKMKKMSDFVIQEEVEADGDAPMPPPVENQGRERRRPDVQVDVSKLDSPLAVHKPILKKQQSNIQFDTTEMKQLEIPENLRSSGLLSSQEIAMNDQSVTQMDLVN